MMPAAGLYIGDYTAIDGRADATQSTGSMIVFCEPTPEQHDALVADPRIEYLVA